MGELLMRRPLLVSSSGGGPEWDVDWSYEDGKPAASGLFTKTTNGTTSETIQETNLQIGASGAGAYVQYAYTTANPTKSVFEVDFVTGGNSGFYFIVSLSNGTNGIAIRCQYTSSYKGIYLMDSSDVASMTKLSSFAMSTNYVLKLVLDGTTASVYKGDTLLRDSIAISGISPADSTRFYFENRGSGYRYAALHSMKLKLGRTS